MIVGIDFTRYFVKDMERATRFYRDTIGLPLTKTFGPDFVEFTLADGTTFALDLQEPWLESSGVSFAVDDIRAAVEVYKERGVEFRYGGEVLESPVCFFAFAADTEGNTFMLHQRK
ncbi:MAG TPA: VOC family protein [Candidatus Elarobacter sp.]|jgi:predicted enzyme related to lactoylglutathione lyase|nr:VOC family protein [Candidatus Elarobacter sp.]